MTGASTPGAIAPGEGAAGSGSAGSGSGSGAATTVAIARDRAAAIVTFDRPKALNALNVEMKSRLAAALPGFARDPLCYCMVIRSASAKAFSAGGDVREIISCAQADRAAARGIFADEYRLCWALECFTKPTVSLIDGVVMGSGVGMSLYGTHRVAGAGYRFAMPETAIGLFPDVGVAHAFARMPDKIGLYLGLTGRAIGRADAYALGLVTHCLDAGEFDAIVAALADADPVDPVLDSRHADPGPGEIEAHRAAISRCFAAPDVAGILSRLEAVEGADRAWAESVRHDLLQRSPTSLAITLRHLRAARAMTIDQVLVADYRLACGCLDGHDFYEGVRAALIDKDGKPAWRPGRIEDVDAALIESHFAEPDGGDLRLEDRAAMQRPGG